MPQDFVLFSVVAVVFFAVFMLSVWPRREGIWFKLKFVFWVEATYLGVSFLVLAIRHSVIEAFVFGILSALVVRASYPSRSRRPRAAEKRKAIARFEYKTGKKYNPKKHDLGHRIPFASGGSNTADNMRVEDRGENRSKGAKSPWWDILGR